MFFHTYHCKTNCYRSLALEHQNNLKTKIIIFSISLLIVLLPFASVVHAALSGGMAGTLYYTIDTIKSTILRGMSPVDVERSIVTPNFKLHTYDNGDIGWGVIDSKNREVFRVILTVSKSKITEGVYLTPLMSGSMANELYAMHEQMMKSSYSSISSNSYDVGNNCSATMGLFRNKFNEGRTEIVVKC